MACLRFQIKVPLPISSVFTGLPRMQRACTYMSTTGTSPHNSGIFGQTVELPSGRLLGYHTAGPTSGIPIIYIHGHPDSGLTITGELENRISRELHVRWIGPDRPGVGFSSPYDSQEVLDYPSDIQSLVEHLGLTEYYIVGTSGGTGFTLACAKNLSRTQLKGVGICAGIGPLEGGFESMDEPQRKALEAWRDHPDEFRQYYESKYVPLCQREDTTALTTQLRSEFEVGFTGLDREVLLEENTFRMAVNVLRQSWVQGAWAHAKGIEFHWKPWGFALEDVAFPGIKLWYGEKDLVTTPTMGRYMSNRLKGSTYAQFPGLSHYTIWRDVYLQKMVRDLIGA